MIKICCLLLFISIVCVLMLKTNDTLKWGNVTCYELLNKKKSESEVDSYGSFCLLLIFFSSFFVSFLFFILKFIGFFLNFGFGVRQFHSQWYAHSHRQTITSTIFAKTTICVAQSFIKFQCKKLSITKYRWIENQKYIALETKLKIKIYLW